MFTLVVRSILLYALILFVVRLMGKRQIGQMQPFELVLTLIIADVATIPMSETKIPFLHGVIPLLTLMVVHFLITILCNAFIKINVAVNGKPIIVVSGDGIDYKSLKKLNISVDDLMEGIRGKGFFSLDEVEYVIVETTGVINVLPKAKNSPLTCSDMNIKKEQTTLPVLIVSDGSILFDNLSIAGFSKEKVEEILEKAGESKLKNVVACSIDSGGKVYFQSKNKSAKVFMLDLKNAGKLEKKT